ncbi:MAG: hypothetical protein U0414_16675 [Polyangiaceae bacterium]
MSIVDAEELRALAEKYETLGAMRRREAAGEPPHENAFYQRLAARFPGALKELDRLPLDEIDRRAHELERAASSGVALPWMVAVAAYHAKLRDLLAAKRRGEAVCEGRCTVVELATAAAGERSGLEPREIRSLLALKPRGATAP